MSLIIKTQRNVTFTHQKQPWKLFPSQAHSHFFISRFISVLHVILNSRSIYQWRPLSESLTIMSFFLFLWFSEEIFTEQFFGLLFGTASVLICSLYPLVFLLPSLSLSLWILSLQLRFIWLSGTVLPIGRAITAVTLTLALCISDSLWPLGTMAPLTAFQPASTLTVSQRIEGQEEWLMEREEGRESMCVRSADIHESQLGVLAALLLVLFLNAHYVITYLNSSADLNFHWSFITRTFADILKTDSTFCSYTVYIHCYSGTNLYSPFISNGNSLHIMVFLCSSFCIPLMFFTIQFFPIFVISVHLFTIIWSLNGHLTWNWFSDYIRNILVKHLINISLYSWCICFIQTGWDHDWNSHTQVYRKCSGSRLYIPYLPCSPSL